ncbi:MAG: type II toxin-antitoxin system YoeB family toxin [Desulfobacteraceae bacterium]|nr:type II toxin-antitoxin system YoeB family toxin [Desulfobacteraceae bacterium]
MGVLLNKKLLGDLAGAYSRRLNIQHRIVYQVIDEEKIIKIISLKIFGDIT